jgi:alpha/beta superfamily hydrolase
VVEESLHENIRGTIPGPAGELEVWLEYPRREPRGILLIAHPHPLHGGTMSNKVVHAVARAALSEGWAALRFNFRGVGASQGVHDEGGGEQQDLQAAAQWVQSELPSLPLRLAGFSFGARIALLSAAAVGVEQLLLIAPPLRLYSDLWLLDRVEIPWAVLMGDADEVIPFEQVQQWVERQQIPPQFEVFPGASHFFHGELVALREKVAHLLTKA